MHKLETLKDMLCRELEEYGERDNLDVGGLDVVDKLAHAIKNIDKIIAAEDEQYSGRRYARAYDRGRYDYDDGRSMRSRGRKRDSMGRYSSGDMVSELRRLMDDAPDEMRGESERMLQRYE